MEKKGLDLRDYESKSLASSIHFFQDEPQI